MNTSIENLTETKFENRKPTNVFSLYFCIGFVVVFLTLVGYCFVHSDINRVVSGYDKCGYVCGQNNEKNSFKGCENGNDKRTTPFLDLDECVIKCSRKELGNRCIEGKNHDFTLFFFDLEESWHAVTSVCITGVVFSYILFVLYRHQTKWIIWGFYITSVFIFVGFSVTAFYYASQTSSHVPGGWDQSDLVFYGVIFAIFAVVYVIYIVCQRKRVPLVIQLFKEASSTLVNVPTLLIQPIWTLFTLVATSILFVYVFMVIESSGTLGISETGKIKFIQDPAMMTARWVNFVAFIWFTQFIIGCQHFVIAGAVSQWYFAKTKTKLDSPVKRSVSHLLRFHLGSICLGSILITIVSIVLTILRFLASSMKSSRNPVAKIFGYIFDYLLCQIERFFEYLVKNAYIIVAKDGTPLITSGKRAIKLFKDHFEDLVALNQIGNVVLWLGKLFIVLICAFVGNALLPDYVDKFSVTVVLVLISFVICHGFLTVFDMTLNTIFICFCDDCDQNDGVSRPYFMSNNLMEVMKDVKKAKEFDFGEKIGDTAMQSVAI